MDKVNQLLSIVDIQLPLDEGEFAQTPLTEAQKRAVNTIRDVLGRAIDRGVLQAGDDCIVFKPARTWAGSEKMTFREPDARVMVAADRHEGNIAKMLEVLAVWSKTETFTTICSLKRQDAEVGQMLVAAFQLCSN